MLSRAKLPPSISSPASTYKPSSPTSHSNSSSERTAELLEFHEGEVVGGVLQVFFENVDGASLGIWKTELALQLRTRDAVSKFDLGAKKEQWQQEETWQQHQCTDLQVSFPFPHEV